MIDGFSNYSDDLFKLRLVLMNEIVIIIKALRTDSSTGPDQTPIRYVKMVNENIAMRIVTLLIIPLRTLISIKLGKLRGCLQNRKVENPISNEELQPVSILPALAKICCEAFVSADDRIYLKTCSLK